MVLALLDCTMDSSRYLNRSLSPGNSTMLSWFVEIAFTLKHCLLCVIAMLYELW